MSTPPAGTIHHLDLTVVGFPALEGVLRAGAAAHGIRAAAEGVGAVAWRGASIIAIQPAKPEERTDRTAAGRPASTIWR